jgi:integrase
MEIRFILAARLSTKGTAAILLRATAGRYRLEKRTGLHIKPEQWNTSKQRPKRNPALTGQLNNIATEVSKKLTDAIELAVKENQQITTTELTAIIEAVITGREVVMGNSFFGVYQQFMAAQVKAVTERTLKKYRTVFNLLQEFERYGGKKLTFAGINLLFFDDFYTFVMERPNKISNRKTETGILNETLDKHISTLKTFMKWAYDRDLHNSTAYKRLKVEIKPRHENVVLNEAELHLLAEYDLSNHPPLERTRDIFLFAVYTGQRYSDISAFNAAQLQGNIWQFEAAKTKKITTVPLVGYAAPALEILQKYNYKLPRYANQVLNRNLKKVGELAGLDALVTLKRYQGVKELLITEPKYKLLSTHTARRTCVTILLQRGVPPTTIMQLTGHTDLRTFMKYDNTPQDALTRALAANSIAKPALTISRAG